MTPLISTEVQVTVGVDTHADVHVAAALDQLGRLLESHAVPTTLAGYRALLAWAGGLGKVDRIGIEGTGSYGAGLARWLRGRGFAGNNVGQGDGLRQECSTGKRDAASGPYPIL